MATLTMSANQYTCSPSSTKSSATQAYAPAPYAKWRGPSRVEDHTTWVQTESA